MKWEEEAHYIHTVQYFVALMKQHGVKQVLEDVKNLDLDIYDAICYNVLQAETKKKQTSVLLRDPYFDPHFDPDGRC